MKHIVVYTRPSVSLVDVGVKEYRGEDLSVEIEFHLLRVMDGDKTLAQFKEWYYWENVS